MIKPRQKILYRRLFLSVIIIGMMSVCSFIVLCIQYPLPKHLLDPPSSLRVLDCQGRTLRVFLTDDDSYYFPCDLDRVSQYVIKSTLSFEDRWFYWHLGINPVSVLRALWINLRAGKVLSGGSTITQQVARLMEPRPRTVGSKIIEAFRACQLELFLSKREILEAYFNLATYGGNIRGIVAASFIYFGNPPTELGPGEAALLAALPNSPTTLRPDRNPNKARVRRNELLHRMLKNGIIDWELYRLALVEDVPNQRLPFPMYAPHLCDDLHSRNMHLGGDLRSTIDRDIQLLATNLLDRHISPLRRRGITNGAVVVIENATYAVRALVGSANYFDMVNSGQVNGAKSPRCPGSTLKPFAYGLGFDSGLISPSTLLCDVPVDFAGYQPKNYDETYRGMVTVSEALTHSMNVPAVNLVKQVGYGQLFNLLKHGLTTLDQPMEHYGLPLILGGVGVNLLDLTNLYAALANGGVWKPYRLLEDDPIAVGDSLFSAATCYLLTDLLSQVRRPDFPECWESSLHLPKIAWKTGTSYGHRDAWSVGYSPRYTIGVWIGNFPGDGNPILVGANIAGPLLFDIAQGLEPEPGTWFKEPHEVRERLVCAVSGMVSGPFCDATIKELYIKNRSPHQICNMHVSYAIDEETHYRLCPHCQVDHTYHHVTFVQLPPELATWMKEHGYATDAIPEHNPECQKGVNGPGPIIISPSDDCHYVVRNGVPLQDQQILLSASVPNEINTIYWFIDGELLYKGRPGKVVFYTPQRGSHEVVCMDNEGRKSSRIMVII